MAQTFRCSVVSLIGSAVSTTMAKSAHLKVEHYVISSGNQEMIEGCPIYSNFRHVFGSKFAYNEHGTFGRDDGIGQNIKTIPHHETADILL